MKPMITYMHRALKEKYFRFRDEMANAGVPFALTCVLRTQAEQKAYYAQGRETLEDVNTLRLAAGMSAIGEKENAYTVTQTMNSRHFPDGNGKSRAFDIAILKNDRNPTWDIKWDGDKDQISDYEEAARIGASVGLIPGARWKTFHDWPHFELPGDIA